VLARVRRLARQVPVLRQTVLWLRRQYAGLRARLVDPERVFTRIHDGNLWQGQSSVSGTGSDTRQTAVIVRSIPLLARELHALKLLDIPCGDFHWMRDADLSGLDYTGADIVRALVAKNADRFARPGVRFVHANLIDDPLPAADLILCRDCLVHFSFADARRALRNMIRSGARYVLTTTFPTRSENVDIRTGQWRPLNLERPPFSFPPPERLIEEQCTEWDGKYRDKSLGLWRLDQINP
jgi:hypothetical protein